MSKKTNLFKIHNRLNIAMKTDESSCKTRKLIGPVNNETKSRLHEITTNT